MALLVQNFHTMSRRTPDKPTIYNSADNVERFLEADNHRIWGWVIYRSTYDSEEDWTEFLLRLRAQIEKTLTRYNGLEMLESLGLKIFEDRALFEGASTSVIREHFKSWAATAPQEEQNTGPARSQRYQFCIQVDAEALHSVVYDALPPSQPNPFGTGWVKLIWKDWQPEVPDPRDITVYDPIEGCTTKEIGWSRAAYQFVMVSTYCLVRDRHDWYREYRRPPTVIIP